MKFKDIEKETNPTAEWKGRRKKILSCSFCPPNKGENAGKGNKFYSKSWKDKTRRKKQYKKIKSL